MAARSTWVPDSHRASATQTAAEQLTTPQSRHLPHRRRVDVIDIHHPLPGQAVRLVGSVGAGNVAEVRQALHEAIDHGIGDLTVDVDKLRLADATGLGALLGAHRRASRASRTLVLVQVGPSLNRVLTYTRLNRVLVTKPRLVPAQRTAGEPRPA
ncbi:MAG TPA: STAS domain-containing protein [Mycobacteriales bacterium]|jgi:anti-anti-sigma factor|nr:STAS domain-containing protein [Mycobacteriales bacterium]